MCTSDPLIYIKMFTLYFLVNFIIYSVESIGLIGRECTIGFNADKIKEANLEEVHLTGNSLEFIPGDHYIIKCPPPNTSVQFNGTDTGLNSIHLSCTQLKNKLNTTIQGFDMGCHSYFNSSLHFKDHRIVKRSWLLSPTIFKTLLPEIGDVIETAIVDTAIAGAAVSGVGEVALGVGAIIGLGEYIDYERTTTTTTEATTTTTKKANSCYLRIVESSPLVFNDFAGILNPVYPQSDDFIEMLEEEEYTITCGEAEILFDYVPIDTHGSIKCDTNGQLKVTSTNLIDEDVIWSNLWCSGPDRVAISSMKKKEAGGRYVPWVDTTNQVVDAAIGWNVGPRFHPQIKIKYDERNENTKYTHHTLQKKYKKVGINRESTIFYPVPSAINDAYRNFYNRQLNYYQIQPKQISKGHLSPNGDFILPAERKATYFYSNTLPQWSSFNSEDWNLLEQLVLSVYGENYLDVYTGGYGVMKSNRWKMTLMNNDKAPVPRAFYKIIYDPSTGNGIGFVGLNVDGSKTANLNKFNQLVSEFGCNGICQQYNWMLTNQKIFCCPIGLMRVKIPEIPFLNVIGTMKFFPQSPFHFSNLNIYSGKGDFINVYDGPTRIYPYADFF